MKKTTATTTKARTRPRAKSQAQAANAEIQVIAGRRVAMFPQVKGKVIESVEASENDGEFDITINIRDRTKLCFSIVPDEPVVSIEADYGDWRTGNFRAIRRWGRLDI